MKLDYIANQSNDDEVRFLTRALLQRDKYNNTSPIAFSGSPGCGKTDCIAQFSRAMSKYGLIFRQKIAGQTDTRYDYTGFPMNISGNSIFAGTEATDVLSSPEGGVLSIDEAEQMPQEVQKELASLLDHRRYLSVIRLVDDRPKTQELHPIKRENVLIAMSYNPQDI